MYMYIHTLYIVHVQVFNLHHRIMLTQVVKVG